MRASGRLMLRSRLVGSPRRSIAGVGLFGFLLAAGVTLSRGGIPAPRIHDEFSYLLAADTFAHGRLANPPHPMGDFFESFHILQRPVYASKYPPAQGAILALGQVITGQPIVGVWLSYALMGAALTWMLLGWVRPRWAVGGGLVATVYFAGFQGGGWAASYWGGAVAATGGALLFGGIKRVLDRPSALPAVLMALGLGVLANSRPYEGLLVAIPPGLAFLWWLRKGSTPTSVRLFRIGGAATLVLGVVALFMASYNARIAGSAWKLPYVAYEEAYGQYSPFLWGGSRSVAYRHEVMKRFYNSPKQRPPARSLAGFAGSIQRKVEVYRGLFLPAFASVIVLLVPWGFRDSMMGLAGASVGLAGLGLLGETWAFGHYAGPLVAPLLLLYVAATRRLGLVRIGRARTGKYLLLVALAAVMVAGLADPLKRLVGREAAETSWFTQRQRLERRLATQGGRHLVVVDYGPSHDPNNEWVYNRAQIDAAPVVWARSLGTVQDARLLEYFSDRVVWALHVRDDGPFELQPLAKPPRQ